MDSEGIFSKVLDVLGKDATLKAYVKHFWAGDRPADSRHQFPNVTLEVTGNPTERMKNNRLEKRLQVIIAGAILLQDFNKQIIGDSKSKGVMDLEKDIYSALYAFFPDMGENCLFFSLSTISYPPLESANGRVVLIQGDFWYVEAQ